MLLTHQTDMHTPTNANMNLLVIQVKAMSLIEDLN
jgi:hypothetical protein